ncbi:MAG: hypothetical protein AB7N61_21800 [Acidimicrobiia bacterium]
MGIRLVDTDEGMHEVGTASNWNESRYVDFYDPVNKVGGWFRIGVRPNEGRAEMSACVYLPDGSVAFKFGREPVTTNTLHPGPQSWEIVEPWRHNKVSFVGDMYVIADPWKLVNPKEAFTTSPLVPCEIHLDAFSTGLDAVMGQDQDQHHLIFLPGQADFHYQHLAHTIGTVKVGDRSWNVDGRGGKDHSWGPRNWHAKIYLRWQIASVNDDFGFMLTRAVGPTKKTRSGFVWQDGTFHVVDDYEMTNTYAEAPNYECRKIELVIHSGERSWTATGTPTGWMPVRHVQQGADGKPALLRIVKSPVNWIVDGQVAVGTHEYHDLMVDGVPYGLFD